MRADAPFKCSPEFPGLIACARKPGKPGEAKIQIFEPLPSIAPGAFWEAPNPLICWFWADPGIVCSQWLSKMINLHALVLHPSLLDTALTMSYCQLSWGREQQFSYNAAFTTSRPVEQKCRFSPQFHIFLNAAIDWSP